MRTQLTLCFVQTPQHILLGMKKRGFGAGRWNGFGGKVDAGETIEDAARREVREEARIEVGTLERIGNLEFVYPHSDTHLLVQVFVTDTYSGMPAETEEMRPQWFATDAIPYNQMWPDDPHWLPLLLNNQSFTGRFIFQDDDTILEHDVVEL